MKYLLFIGYILADGKAVYEKNLVTELKQQTDHLEIISINKGYSKLEDSFQVIPIHTVKALKKPLVDEIFRFFYMVKLLAAWYRKVRRSHEEPDARIILLNASIEITLAVVVISKLYRIKTSSLLIDTALGNFRPDTIWNKYLYFCYAHGEQLYQYLDGCMALNPRVFNYLGLSQKPTHLTKVGYTDCADYLPRVREPGRKTVIYTGSLMYYDGTEELLDAAVQLAEHGIDLHIYGSGPLLETVKQFSAQYDNIKYMGYLPNSKIQGVLAGADFLINPRIPYFYTDIFGFPSKIIEYLLSGTPVITTAFSAMPNAYREFVYLISEPSSTGIQDAILAAVYDDPARQEHKARVAYHYIKAHYQYRDIVRDMLGFVFSL